MPNELTVQAVPAVPSATEKAVEPKAEPLMEAHNAPVTTPPAAVGAAQAFINPTVHMDPTLGLVVIEFRDETGRITSSIPSQRQLEAYRMHQQEPPNHKPGPPDTSSHAIVPQADKS
jgi:hypothetical protein